MKITLLDKAKKKKIISEVADWGMEKIEKLITTNSLTKLYTSPRIASATLGIF